MAGDGVDTMWFLPSALNIKVKKFIQARAIDSCQTEEGGHDISTNKKYNI